MTHFPLLRWTCYFCFSNTSISNELRLTGFLFLGTFCAAWVLFL